MGTLRRLHFDPDKETHGVERDFVVEDGKIPVLVGSTTNPDYQRERSKLIQPYLQRIRQGEATDEEIRLIVAPAVAKFILLKFMGGKLDDGTDLSHFNTPERKLEVLENPGFGEFYEWLLATGSNPRNFGMDADDQRKAEQDSAGN